MSSQLEDLTRHLLSGKSITSIQAAKLYGITCLPKRCCELESHVRIRRKWKEGKNRHGKQIRYLEYYV